MRTQQRRRFTHSLISPKRKVKQSRRLVKTLPGMKTSTPSFQRFYALAETTQQKVKRKRNVSILLCRGGAFLLRTAVFDESVHDVKLTVDEEIYIPPP